MTQAKSIVVLSGAGISAPSGIPTFRDDGGVWRTHEISDVCTFAGWVRNPTLVNKFHDEARRAIQDAQPNAAHLALATWEAVEECRGNAFTILTQNVDDLHERAGSNTLIHLHGEILKASCETCGMELRWTIDLLPGDGQDPSLCPFCGSDSLRPAVTWFGEFPAHYREMDDYLATADVLVIVGTSGAIYNPANFSDIVHENGGRVVYVNLEAPPDPDVFDEVVVGSAELVVPRFVQRYLDGQDAGRSEAVPAGEGNVT